MKIAFAVLILLVLFVRFLVRLSVRAVRKIMKKPAKKRRLVWRILDTAVPLALAAYLLCTSSLSLTLPNLPGLPSLPNLTKSSGGVVNSVFGNLFFSEDGFVYEVSGLFGKHFSFRDVLYRYEVDGNTVRCTDPDGKKRTMNLRGSVLFDNGGDGVNMHRRKFTAKPDEFSGKVFRGETDDGWVASQFTLIFYDNGEYALGWRYLGSGNLKGGDSEDSFGIYEYSPLTKTILLPKSTHWCGQTFTYDKKKGTLTGTFKGIGLGSKEPFEMTEISFEELGVHKNETLLVYDKDSEEYGPTVHYWSKHGSLVSHSLHSAWKTAMTGTERTFDRFNEYVYYRLYQRKNIAEHTFREVEIPFVPSEKYPDPVSVVTRRKSKERDSTYRESMFMNNQGNTNFKGGTLKVYDVPEGNVVKEIGDEPVYVDSKMVSENWKDAYYYVHSIRFEEKGYRMAETKALGWMKADDVILYTGDYRDTLKMLAEKYRNKK